VFENVGWGEILVLLVAGLFILGPERLPEAAAWLGKTIRQIKDFASGARDQLKTELGPEYEQLRKPLDDLRGPLRELRDLDPRRSLGRSFFDTEPGTKPNGYAPGPGVPSTPPTANGASSGAPSSAAAPAVRPLAADERPPIDPDAT
jgi:sec-independent protein translocase protein TatB